MSTVSISDLKTNPGKTIAESLDYPVAIMKRNKTQAYIVGKDLFENLVSFIEDSVDIQAAKNTDYKNTTDFEEIAKELGL